MITYAAPGFPLYYIDERMLALLDYSSQAELIAANGQAMINCIRPEDRVGRQAEIAQALLNGASYTTTYRMMCRDRGHIWVKETGVQRRLPNGASVLVSLCLDITGQIEAQAELESIVQCPIGGIFRARMDHGFTLIYANDYYYALHGFTREGLRNQFGNKTIHLVHPEDIDRLDEQLTLHDFRIIRGPTHTNVIFDVVVPFHFKMTDAQLRSWLDKRIKQIDPSYFCVINIDKN